jgi:hypothetical protein
VSTSARTRPIAILAGVVGGLYLLLGAGELAARLDDPASLLFWLPSLWGGGALVLLGVFRRAVPSVRAVAAGALLGMIATAWTLVVPVLAIALVVLVIRTAHPRPATP